MSKLSKRKKVTVVVYNGYGHTHNMIIFGHVLKNRISIRKRYSRNILINFSQLIKLFIVKPIGGVKVQLEWRGQVFIVNTEIDGFFKFEWQSRTEVEAGWHQVTVNCVDVDGKVLGTGQGEIDVPNSTQYGFISDVDDTVLVSYSANPRKKLKLLFTKTRIPERPLVKLLTIIICFLKLIQRRPRQTHFFIFPIANGIYTVILLNFLNITDYLREALCSII